MKKVTGETGDFFHSASVNKRLCGKRKCKVMHPVDFPAVGDTDLTAASTQYLCALKSGLHSNEYFWTSQTSKVAITTNNIRQLQLFEDEHPKCTLLALHPPDDPEKVIAVYLHEKWWSVDDILHTSSKSRSGLIPVQSIVERVIVFLLSQVVERSPQEETLFSLHSPTESCKLLWSDSQVVGFYSIKHKGSLCDSWSGCCYLLPVLDTVLVRRSCRRRGFGLQMLEDFCSAFPTETFLGISAPLSPSMVTVCRRFLQQHEETREHLYEVEAPEGWTQRRNIWLNIRLGRYSPIIDEERRETSGETPRNEGDGSSKMEKPDPSCKKSGTGCKTAAHSDPKSESLIGPQSANREQGMLSEPSQCTDVYREDPEVQEMLRSAKRRKRT